MKKNTLVNVSLLLGSFLFVFVVSLFAVFESIQALVPTFISGAFTRGIPLSIFYYTAHFIFMEGYMKLYYSFPSVPWYELASYSYLSLAVFVILKKLFNGAKTSDIKLKLALIALVLFLITEYVLTLEATRIAFSLGTASTLILLGDNRKYKYFNWWTSVFFLLGILTRPETGVLVLIIQAFLYLFVRRENSYLRGFLGNTAVAVLIMGIISYDRLSTSDFMKQFEPELGYQLLDRKNIVPISEMKNAVDSMKYIGVNNLITDTAFISINFLRGLVGVNSYWGVTTDLIERTKEIFIYSATNASGLIIIYVALLFLLLKQQLSVSRSKALKFWGFTISVWAIILTIIYFIKMERWVFNSVMLLLIFILINEINWNNVFNFKTTIYISFTVVLLGIYMEFVQEQNYMQQIKHEVASNIVFTDRVKAKYKNKIIMPGISQLQMLFNCIKPYQLPDFTAFKRIYLLDCDVVYIEEHYNKFLQRECNCEAGSFSNLWDFLAGRKDEVSIIMDEERKNIIHDYLRIVRNKNYTFTPVDSIPCEDRMTIIYRLE